VRHWRGKIIIPATFLVGTVVGGAAVGVWQEHQQRLVPAMEKPPAQRWEATIYLPSQHKQADWDRALEILIRRFGGATLGPPQEGCWLNSNQEIHRDPIRPVIVSFDRGNLDAFRQAVREIGQYLHQEAIYIRFEEPRVELIRVSGGTGD